MPSYQKIKLWKMICYELIMQLKSVRGSTKNIMMGAQERQGALMNDCNGPKKYQDPRPAGRKPSDITRHYAEV